MSSFSPAFPVTRSKRKLREKKKKTDNKELFWDFWEKLGYLWIYYIPWDNKFLRC